MRFLVDENLPLTLAHWLREQGHQADHTSMLGFNATPDLEIAKWADDMDAVVVTKDRDYVALAGRDGARVVHVRTGNLTTERLLSVCSGAWSDIVASLTAGERVVKIGSDH